MVVKVILGETLEDEKAGVHEGTGKGIMPQGEQQDKEGCREGKGVGEGRERRTSGPAESLDLLL